MGERNRSPLPLEKRMISLPIRMNHEDTFEWVMSSDLLEEMSKSHADKAFYSGNFGVDNNWCLACIPRPTRCRNPGYVKFKLLILRMPAYWSSVTTALTGNYGWTS